MERIIARFLSMCYAIIYEERNPRAHSIHSFHSRLPPPGRLLCLLNIIDVLIIELWTKLVSHCSQAVGKRCPPSSFENFTVSKISTCHGQHVASLATS